MFENKDTEEALNGKYSNATDRSGNDKNEEKEDATDAEEKEQQAEDHAFKKELDTNFPLSGGGTDPFFTNEEA